MRDKEHVLYNGRYDKEIEALYRDNNWRAYRIVNYLTQKYGKQVISIATVNARLATLRGK
jgi:hypothetical protein